MRWPQFSLRTLLVGFCLAAVVLCWGSVQYQRATNQRRVVAQLATLGATVTYDWQLHEVPSKNAVANPNPGPPTWLPDAVRDALGHDYFQNVVAVEIDPFDMPDQPDSDFVEFDVFAALQSLTSLESLEWQGIRLEESDYAKLAKLTRLKVLKLDTSSAANVGLEALGQMKQLTSLQLGIWFWTEPDGLDKLAGMPLEELELRQSWRNLEGEGPHFLTAPCDLLALAKMPRLKKLKLSNINFSKTEFELLLKLPQLEELELSGIDQLKIDFDLSAASRQLKKLRIKNCLVTEAELRKLVQLPGLQELELDNLDRDPPPLTREIFLTCAKEYPHLKLFARYYRVMPDGTFVRNENWSP